MGGGFILSFITFYGMADLAVSIDKLDSKKLKTFENMDNMVTS